MSGPLMTIGQVAERAGVRTSRIRFYERVGVLPEPERVGGQRRYRSEVLQRLSAIDVAQRAGLSLDEIAPLTGGADPVAEPGPHLRALADDKLAEIDALIARAEAAREWLQAAQACECATVDACGLFADPSDLPRPLDFTMTSRSRVSPAPRAGGTTCPMPTLPRPPRATPRRWSGA